MIKKTILCFDNAVLPNIQIEGVPPVSLAVGTYLRFGDFVPSDIQRQYDRLVKTNHVFLIDEIDCDWGADESTLTLYLIVKPE